ncbi:MAG TPA: choice-of-anchor D domain-containing protein, partial [Polyangiaceae bacterium]|nr:choice-of-anchor D domain-containing protein [Polyangiaceae bacterium]
MSARVRGRLAKLMITLAAALLLAAQCSDARLSFDEQADIGFGPVAVGSVQHHTYTLRNTGTAEATLTAFSVTPYQTGPNPFSVSGGTCITSRRVAANGGTCTVIVAYAPTAPSGTRASLQVLYNWTGSGVGDRAVDLPFIEGTGVGGGVLLSDRPGHFDFELQYLWQAIGSASAYTVTLQNYMLSDVVLGPVTSVGVGLAPGFSVSGGTCATGLRLPTNASCTLEIRFSPSEVRGYESFFAVTYTFQGTGPSGQTQRVRVSGAGMPPLAISDVAFADTPGFDFGPLSLGSTVKKVLTVVNWQPGSVTLGTLSNAALGLQPPFEYAGGSCASGSVLAGAGNGSCTLQVRFT